jgi:hypothetical protein
MTSLRVPLSFHAAIDLTAGLGLMAAPLALGFGPLASFVAIALGALFAGLGFATTAPEGRGIVGPAAHAAYDIALGAGLIAAGFAVGIAGDVPAFSVLASVGVAGLLLSGFTRYSVTFA